MFNKLMSIGDELMPRYWELLTDKSLSEIAAMKTQHPREVKINLGKSIVTDFHSAADAEHAASEWLRVVSGGEVPADLQSVEAAGALRLDKALTKTNLASSGSDAQRRIKEGAVDINYENRSGQDVTSQYVDLQSQLKAKEAAEKKLLEILDQATKAEDVLAIYLQVQTVQTEIEQLKGQIKYLEESADLSAISVRLIAEEGTQPIEVGPWKPEGAAKAAIQDLIFFVQNFAEFLIRFVLYNLPALILIGIPLYLVFLGGRALFRRFRKQNEKVEQSEEAKKE